MILISVWIITQIGVSTFNGFIEGQRGIVHRKQEGNLISCLGLML